VLIANRLSVPDGTPALLWDMDGVLLDTLTMDFELVNQALRAHAVPEVSRQTIREYFPYDIPQFWRLLIDRVGLEVPPDVINELVREHEKGRESADIVIHDGVVEILAEAKARGLEMAVVSNNPGDAVDRMLVTAGLRDYFSVVVGNDDPGMAKKPAPDCYFEAVRRLGVTGGVPPVAIEDSLLGAQAAHAAGCWTVGVATGAVNFRALSASPYVNRTYANFSPCQVSVGWEGVKKKSLVSPNEFVSHMIEHIAWRLGSSVDVAWTNDDWQALGNELGLRVGKLCHLEGSAATLGMIDDGSCEVSLRRDGAGYASLRAADQVDLEWFLGLRCEQLADGRPLVSLLHGLAAGSGVSLDIFIASAEDPHHTWEGIFRGVGIGLKKLAGGPAPVTVTAPPSPTREPLAAQPSRPQPVVEQGWDIRQSSVTRAQLRRETAESIVELDLELGGSGAECVVAVSDSISVEGMTELLNLLAVAAGLRMAVSFNATRLSSSHVVTEDIGMALGRALRCIAVERMSEFGINGAGSSISSTDDLTDKAVRVGVSMEGRKFWKFVPLSRDYADLRRRFLIGRTLPNGLFSEDLDDFVDGLAGGLSASVMIHVIPDIDPAVGWPLVFEGLGSAISELLAPNPDRKALTPGVKATLA